MNEKLIGSVRKSPLHQKYVSVYKSDKRTSIRIHRYDPSDARMIIDSRAVPQLIELLKESMKDEQNISN